MPDLYNNGLFRFLRSYILFFILGICSLLVLAQTAPEIRIPQNDNPLEQQLRDLLERLDVTDIPSGILYDRVLSFSDIADYAPGNTPPNPATTEIWAQMLFELSHAADERISLPRPAQLKTTASSAIKSGIIPVSLFDIKYEKIREDALQEKLLTMVNGQLVDTSTENISPYNSSRAIAAAALKPTSYFREITFDFSPQFYISNHSPRPAAMQVDFGDGSGYRTVNYDSQVTVNYLTTGEKLILLKIEKESETVEAAFRFTIKKAPGISGEMNTPDIIEEDLVANYDYLGTAALYDAYTFLGDGNTDLDKPLIFVEGFDLSDDMDWPELYALINTEGLADSLRVKGFDMIILNFADATDYLQRNSLAFVSLVENINQNKIGDEPLIIAGASMGGLIVRYGLAWMESNAIDHQARIMLTFDTPHQGANIPLGVQFMAAFFSNHVASIDELLTKLNSPGAQQMLVYHHLNDPDPGQNALRNQFYQDIAALGNYPSDSDLKKVAISNGSGAGTSGNQVGYLGEAMNPGSQIVDYNYFSFLVDVRGNVWAVPDNAPQIRIFQGLVDLIWPLPDDQLDAYAVGTSPYDNAPGGTSATMEDLANTDTGGLGTIKTDFPKHCFIPTVSSLDLQDASETPLDLFHDLNNDSDLMSKTPFDTIYFPSSATNEDHVAVTIANTEFMLAEVEQPYLAVATKIFLEGPYNPTSNLMNTVLGDNELLPLNQPFNQAPWSYAGTEALDSIPDGMVDWVYLQLRSSNDALPSGERAAILMDDGNIVDVDGGAVIFKGLDPAAFYLTIFHRNHLAVMSAAALPLSKESTLYNFTTAQSQALGTSPMRAVESGVFALPAGDGNKDGGVDALDKGLIWRLQNGSGWTYEKLGDFNLDGGIDALDINLLWRGNNGTATQVPSSVAP